MFLTLQTYNYTHFKAESLALLLKKGWRSEHSNKKVKDTQSEATNLPSHPVGEQPPPSQRHRKNDGGEDVILNDWKEA